MIDNQFELGGVVFGDACPVDITPEGWKPGGGELQSSSTPDPTTDGVRFGRSLRGAALWEYELFTNVDTEADAWAALTELQEQWDADEIRLEPGPVVPLRYRIAGQVRRVYGRPRRWTRTVDNKRLGGNLGVVADFELVEDTVYEDDEDSVTIGLGVPLDPDAGVIPPFILPFDLAPGSVERQSSIEIGGDKKTPVWVTFSGPVANAQVQIGGWKAGLVDPVDIDDPVTIDARPWVRAATRASGGGVRVDPRITKISKMWLPPGHHEVIFTGADITSTATVTVSWRNARRSPR